MFVRQATTHATKDGPGRSHRLCSSVRVGSRVKQVTHLNLGVDFPVPRSQWTAFAKLVEALDQVAELLIPPDPQLLPLATAVAQQLQDRRLARAATPAPGTVATVQLDSLAHQPTRSVGGERLALAALRQLRFPAILRGLGFSDRHARYACALVLARMLRPSSERAAQAWLARRSAALELLGLDDRRPPSDNLLHRVGDRLWAVRERLEHALGQREETLFDGPQTICFYDLTNLHYHGPARDDLQFGRSKQKRSDCPLVTLAMALDESGFPRCTEVLPGNVSEPGTLQSALRQLARRAGDPAPQPLVVMDAGIATKANLAWLREQGYDWITVRRGKRQAPPRRTADCTFVTRCGLVAKAWQLSAADAAELEICIWSEQRQRKEDAILAAKRQRFEKELAQLHAGLTRKGCTKRYDKVVERLGRLRERYKLVAGHYDIEVERPADTDQGSPGPRQATGSPQKARKRTQKARKPPNATAVKWQLNATGMARNERAGAYELRTSRTGWDLERVVRIYWRLTEIEATFRSLKSELGLRPVWHRKKQRIRSHLFLGVLAFHAVHALRRQLAAQGMHDSWRTIRNKLGGWERVTSMLRTVQGRLIENRQDTRPAPEAARIARAVGVDPKLHRKRV